METIVYAKAKKGRENYLLVIPECPFCGETHTHGGGSLENPDAPFSLQGHRVSHCADGLSRGYFVVIDGWLKK